MYTDTSGSRHFDPTIQLAHQFDQSPAAFHTPHTHFSQPTPTPVAASGQIYTPPTTAESLGSSRDSAKMNQRRMSSHGQRPIMGPPETPSRGMIPQSPNLFTNAQFSPDLFSQHMMDAQSLPMYPQQRLFWDPTTTTPLQGTPQQFHTPTSFPDDFNNSFNSTSTIMPHHFMNTSQDLPYDLPTMTDTMTASFMHGPVFPAPFQTSPRAQAPPIENPTLFLSSPARRFGGDTTNETSTVRRKLPELPAYHHQLQESRREKEMLARDRRKSRSQRRTQDDDLVMKSVRRALSPSKTARPSMTRSVTLGGIRPLHRQSSLSFDNVSVGSSLSSQSVRGRSSPIRRVHDTSRRSSASSALRSKPSLTLEIDNHGVARAIMNSLPEDVDEDMHDDDLTDELSSDDGNDQQMLYSFSGSTHGINDTLESYGDARDELRSNPYISMGADRIPQAARKVSGRDTGLTRFDPTSTIRRVRGETLTSTSTDANTNAQQALKAMMLDRSRSASSHASSSSSMQFHSSPPSHQSHRAGYNASPTTITDPGLGTPSTDAGSLGSSGITRCVCQSGSTDGNIMMQCDACSKWLHAKCVGLNNRTIPDVYICPFCSDQTPIRGGTVRANIRQPSFGQSPLAHKSTRKSHRLR